MLRILLVSVLLGLDPAWGKTNGPETKVLREYICDDEPIIQMQHHLEILSLGMENIRLRMENMNMILNDISNKQSAENCSGLGPKKNETYVLPTSCLGLAGGLQVIQLNNTSPFMVPCDNATQGGGWTVIQRRLDGSTDFNRNWTAYKRGFGDLEGEFFIGLDKLHKLTTSYANELLIIMRDKKNESRFAKYDAFVIGDEDEYYPLKTLGKHSGDVGDSLIRHLSMRFSTQDNDNGNTCTVDYSNGWWYERIKYCHSSQLNGKYGNDTYGQGINWQAFHGFEYSLPYVQIMIRPKSSKTVAGIAVNLKP